PSAAGKRQRLQQLEAAVEADLAAAILGAAKLAKPESGFLLARISEQIVAGAVMLGLDQPGRRGAGGRRRGAGLRLVAAHRNLCPYLGRFTGPVAQVSAGKIGGGLVGGVVQRGRGDLQLLVARPPGRAAAGIELGAGD